MQSTPGNERAIFENDRESPSAGDARRDTKKQVMHRQRFSVKSEKGFGYKFKSDCKAITDKAQTTTADLAVTCPECLKVIIKKKGEEIRSLMLNLERATK